MVNDPVRAAQFSKTLQEVLQRSPATSLDQTPRAQRLEALIEIIRGHVRTEQLQWALHDWIAFTDSSYEDTSQIAGWYRQEFLD